VGVGEIKPDGSFTIKTGPNAGTMPGSYGVTVHCRRELTPEEIQSRTLKIPESLIPGKYSNQDESPLTYEVQAGMDNVMQLDLD
jgi:hypothetical protein